jgi:D-aminoacyl-tRNA deacylase
MGNKGISLSLSDPAALTMLKFFRQKGFKEFDSNNVLKLGNIFLIILDPLIVPETRGEMPSTLNPYPTDYDQIAAKYDLDYYVIASRHWAQSGQPSLTVHATGNFSEALYGGRPRELQFVPANPMRRVFLKLIENPPHGFQVSLEATHHSPTQFKTPLFFAEVGSSLTQWENEGVCSYLVGCILAGIESEEEAPIAIGFGGGHYCPKFSVLEKEYAFSHIAAKYSLQALNEDLFTQMVEKSVGKVKVAFAEGSLKGSEKKMIHDVMDKLGVPFIIK